MKKGLPIDILNKGEWHIHTDYTDGKNSVFEYCKVAERLGIPLLAFTEHVRKKMDYDFDQFVEDVQNLYSIYEQIEASDSTTSHNALARLEFLLAEYHENTGEIEFARAGYERVILQYANTIWVPKAALNIATTSAQLGDSTRYRQSLELVVDNFPDTRYADRARRLLGFPVPERPPGFYLDELAAYTPPKIRRKEAAAIGGAAKAGAPGQETWLQMRRRLWRNRFGTSGGGA